MVNASTQSWINKLRPKTTTSSGSSAQYSWDINQWAWTPRTTTPPVSNTPSYITPWGQVWSSINPVPKPVQDSHANESGGSGIDYWISQFVSSWGNSSARASSIPTAPAYSPLVQSTVQPQWAERSADWTSWYLSEEEKKKRGIVDITSQVQPWFDGSTQKFNQWQLTEDQLRARYEADLASGASQEQMQREYGDMWAPEWMGAVWSQERMARQKQQAADKAIQDELQWLTRAGQLFDRGNEDLLSQKDRWQEKMDIDVERAKEDRQFQLDEYRKNVNRNIEDTGKQRDETMQTIRRQSAALWLNVVSTYQQSYKNTQDKFNQVINRMQEDLSTQEGRSTLEDKRLDADYTRATKQLLQDYEKESTRLKQDFEYSTRDYRENLILDANKLVEQYGLSSDKLWARLQELSLDAFNKVETAYGSFLDNSQKQTDILDSQVNNVLDTRNKYLTQQKTYADNFLAWSQNMTITDLNAMVRDGQISEQMAQQTLGQVVQMALDTIDTATVDGVWIQFQDQIIEAINAWMTPMQAVQQVMASEEFAPVVNKMQELWLSSYQKALAQIQIAQWQQGLKQGQQEIDMNDIKFQTASQELLDTVIAKGGVEWIVAYSQSKRGKTNLQCGELVNDYWQNITGKRPWASWMGNDYPSKVKAIDEVGRSSVPMEWGMFAQNIWPNGHTGIVMAVNADGSIEVLEANAGGTKEGSQPTINTYSAATVKNLVFSQPPIGGNVSWKAPTASELAMFDKWAQYIGEKWGLTQARFNEIADYQKANPVEWANPDQQKANRQIQGMIKWDKTVDSFKTIKSAYNSVQSVASWGVNKKNKATVDQALIMLFNKVLDPNSVVKEWEYARSTEWQAYLDWLAAKYNKFVYGWQGIDDKTRTEMLSVIWDLYKAAEQWMNDVKQQYIDTATDMGGTEAFVEKYFDWYWNGWTTQAPQQNTVKAKRWEFEPTAWLQSSPLFKLTQ